MDRRFQFEIPVRRCLNGHVWLDNVEVEGFNKPTSVLAARTAADPEFDRTQAAMEPYEPLSRESGLFRIFAGLPIEPNPIRKFADAHGLIYDLVHRFRFVHKGREYQAIGTPLPIWRQTILAVRHWVTIWDFVCADDARGLLKYVEEFPHQLKRSDLQNPVIATHMAHSDPILNEPAKTRLRVAKERLRFGVWESELRENITVHLKYDENRDTFGFRLRGEDLAVAIWAQFAMAVIDNKEYQCCKTCGKPFEVSPEVARTNREYCGTPCRLKAYRARQREAVRLKHRGKSLKEIASKLESDVKTVRGWIKKAEER